MRNLIMTNELQKILENAGLELNAPYAQGYRARMNGAPLSMNPFENVTSPEMNTVSETDVEKWQKGWLAADRKMKGKDYPLSEKHTQFSMIDTQRHSTITRNSLIYWTNCF